jgi:hypothetical protein
MAMEFLLHFQDIPILSADSRFRTTFYDDLPVSRYLASAIGRYEHNLAGNYSNLILKFPACILSNLRAFASVSISQMLCKDRRCFVDSLFEIAVEIAIAIHITFKSYKSYLRMSNKFDLILR